MTTNPPAEKRPLTEKEKTKRRLAEAAISAVVLHIALGVVAGAITIVVIVTRPPVTFDAKQPPSIPARKLEHSIRVKQMQQQTRKPQVLERLVSQSPSAVALPELPKMDMPDQKNMKDTPMASPAGGILGALGGSGGGAGRGLTGGSGYSDTKFFGENVRTKAICLLLDASQTLINKGVLDDVVRESGTMLSGLAPVTKFNMIGFVDGAAAMFPQMVFATQANKSNALARLKTRDTKKGKGDGGTWTEAGFVPNYVGNLSGYSGSTPWKAIELAVEMGADTVFIVMDDEPPYVKQGGVNDGVVIESHMDDILDYVKNIETLTGHAVKFNVVMTTPRDNKRGQDAVEFYKKFCKATGGKLTFFDPKAK